MFYQSKKIISQLPVFNFKVDASKLTDKEDGILVCLKLWDIAGQHPQKVYKWSQIVLYVYWTCAFLNLILAFCKFSTTNGDLKKFANTAESVIMFTHITMKAGHVIVFKSRVASLLSSKSKRFWSLDDFDPETRATNRFFLWMTYALARTFIFMAIWTVTAMCGKPFLSNHDDESENLPFSVFIPNVFGINRIAILCLQIPMFYYTLFIIVGLDMFYMSLCTHCLVQFRLISEKLEKLVSDKYMLRTIQEEENLCMDIKKIANHHAYLLWFSNELKDILSPLFLGQLVITLGTNCIELYVCLESANSFGEFAYIFTYLASLYFEFALYCFIANELSEATENVCDSIYSSDWFFSKPAVRENLLFMMVRAQRRVNFTACGLTCIKRETFTAVFKFSLSVLTMLRSKK